MISTFEVRLLDRDKPVTIDVRQNTAEAVARAAATSILKLKPASLDLFALKSGLKSCVYYDYILLSCVILGGCMISLYGFTIEPLMNNQVIENCSSMIKSFYEVCRI